MLNLTGIHFNYFYICDTKLWLYSHHIREEVNSYLVYDGKVNHEEHFNRENKEVKLPFGVIDFIDKNGYINEYKRSAKMKKATLMQTIHYMINTDIKKAFIHYKDKKTIEEVILNDNHIKEYSQVKDKILNIINLEFMPTIKEKGICKKCAYEEFCFA